VHLVLLLEKREEHRIFFSAGNHKITELIGGFRLLRVNFKKVSHRPIVTTQLIGH
jgi:hypothetical protein